MDSGGAGRLERFVLQEVGADKTETGTAAALFVLIGAQPHTDWLPANILRDPQGFILTDDHLPRAGCCDNRWSWKRVCRGFAVGEVGVAIQSIHRYLTQTTAHTWLSNSPIAPKHPPCKGSTQTILKMHQSR